MITSTKSSMRNFYRFLIVLPLFGAAYFAIKPVMARAPEKTDFEKTARQLKDFEGYYQFEKDKDAYIQIFVKGDHLALKQMWDKEEFTFEQKSELEFYNKEHEFPLKFIRSADGQISQVIAFSRDVWNKIKNYVPVIQKELQLTPDEMKAFEGSYKLRGNDGVYLQFTPKRNHIVVKESWSGKEITIAPKSPLEFFGTDMRYPVQFTKDNNGKVTQALIFGKDVWEKVKK